MEVRSLEWIENSARAAADELEAAGTVPVNPFLVGSDAHKAWALEFYDYSIKKCAAQAA